MCVVDSIEGAGIQGDGMSDFGRDGARKIVDERAMRLMARFEKNKKKN